MAWRGKCDLLETFETLNALGADMRSRLQQCGDLSVHGSCRWISVAARRSWSDWGTRGVKWSGLEPGVMCRSLSLRKGVMKHTPWATNETCHLAGSAALTVCRWHNMLWNIIPWFKNGKSRIETILLQLLIMNFCLGLWKFGSSVEFCLPIFYLPNWVQKTGYRKLGTTNWVLQGKINHSQSYFPAACTVSLSSKKKQRCWENLDPGSHGPPRQWWRGVPLTHEFLTRCWLLGGRPTSELPVSW